MIRKFISSVFFSSFIAGRWRQRRWETIYRAISPVARPRRAGNSLSRFGEYYFAYIEMRVVHAATEL